MTQDLQVVARFKGDGPIRFTKTCTLQDLFKEIQSKIPVDVVYFIVPHEDGMGYSLREAGVIIPNILDVSQIEYTQDQVSSTADGDQITDAPLESNPSLPASDSSQYSFQEVSIPQQPQEVENKASQRPKKKRGRPTLKGTEVTDQNGHSKMAKPGDVEITKVTKASPLEAEQASLFGQPN